MAQRVAEGDGRPAPLALRLYLWMIGSFWCVCFLQLLVGSQRKYAAGMLWFQAEFADFGYYYDRIQLLHRPEFWTASGAEWNYPAPCIFVYQLFYAFNRGHGGPHPVHFGFMAYMVFAGMTLVVWGLMLMRAMRRRGAGIGFAWAFAAMALVLCWPFYFGMERGNTEVFLDVGVVFGLLAYMRGRWWLAAVVIGLFGAGKIYPLLFLALFLPARRWKEFAGGLGATIAISVFATHWIGAAPANAAKAQRGIVSGVSSWVMEYGMTFEARLAQIDHSLFGLVKRLTLGHPGHAVAVAITYAVVAGLAMLALFFGRIWKMPRPNQLLMVSVATVLLPPTSFDYTMILLLPVWAWMVVLSLREDVDRRWMTVAMAAFAVLFAPESFLIWHGEVWAGQVKAVMLLVLLAISAAVRLEEEPHGWQAPTPTVAKVG